MGARYPDKVALVTDALCGNGSQVALRLAQRGFAVAISYTDRIEQADDLVDRIIERGGRAVAIFADIRIASDAAHLVADTVRLLGRLDVVVNNLAALPAATPADDEFFSAGTVGILHMLQHASPRLAPRGRIINLGVAADRRRPLLKRLDDDDRVAHAA